MATGVLLVCLGVATRLAEWATGADKTYRAEVRFGVETDSYDADGRVVEERDAAGVTRAEVESALPRFVGEIDQRAPAFSAIQVGGQRLYDLARRGEAVEPPVRRVTIRRLTLIDWQSPVAVVEVECSKGTYVRSIAHDLGDALGVGAHLSGLRRIASGGFRIEDAVSLEDAVELISSGRGEEVLRPLDLAVVDFPRLDPGEQALADLRMGRPWRPESDEPSDRSSIMLGRVHDGAGELAAIVERREDGWWPTKVLVR
jgi:tRNA pseudouridine55 synthase